MQKGIYILLYELTNVVKEKINLEKRKFLCFTNNNKTNTTKKLSPRKMIDIYQIINNAYEIRINSDIIKCMHQYIEENNIQKLFNVIMKNNNYLFLDEITRTLLLNEQ